MKSNARKETCIYKGRLLTNRLFDFQPQHITLDLRHPITLFSGISPPPELLATLANLPPNQPQNYNNNNNNGVPTRKPVLPFRPSSASGTTVAPHQLQHDEDDAPPPVYSEAPPSYEDAVADQLPPVNGTTRPEFAPPASGGQGEDRLLPREGEGGGNPDRKRGWH